MFKKNICLGVRIRKGHIKKLVYLSRTLKEVLHQRVLHGRKDGKAGKGRMTWWVDHRM